MYTLLQNNPDYEFEFRVANFGHNAKDGKKVISAPYQAILTGNYNFDELIKNLDEELDEVFKIFNTPEKLADYMGTKSLEIYEKLSDDELDDKARDHLDSTLVSVFTNYFFAGEFVIEDVYFKQRLVDIVKNIIKPWLAGSVPLRGHYRYMVTDAYAVLQVMNVAKHNRHMGEDNPYMDGEDVIVPEDLGIPANHIVMVDDDDKDFLVSVKDVTSRMPKMKPRGKGKFRIGKITDELDRNYMIIRLDLPKDEFSDEFLLQSTGFTNVFPRKQRTNFTCLKVQRPSWDHTVFDTIDIKLYEEDIAAYNFTSSPFLNFMNLLILRATGEVIESLIINFSVC